MAYEVKYKNGGTVTFDKPPTMSDIAEAEKANGWDTPAQPEKKPGYLSRVGTDIVQGLKNAGQNVAEGFKKGNLNIFGETGLRVAGDLAGAAMSPITEAITSGINAAGESISNSPEVQRMASTDGVGRALETVGAMSQGAQALAEQYPNASKDLGAALNIASLLPTGAGLKGVEATVGDAGTLAKRFWQTATPSNNALKDAVESGARPTVNLDTLSGAPKKLAKEAVKQGFPEPDVKFMASLAPEDRGVANRMLDLTEQAATNSRVLDRPIDLAGDTLVGKIKIAIGEMKKAGSAVETEANKLRGYRIDTAPIQERAAQTLLDLGIHRNPLDGKLVFDKSIFKLTPNLQSTIEKFVDAIPTGMTDAYDLHIFKKTIDELVNYGTQGEGLKGTAERVLKSLRNVTDETLDSNFSLYNIANTEFRNAKTIVDNAKDLFGKKNSLDSGVRGGQILRSAFSNNTTRQRVYSLAQALDAFEKKITGSVNGSALDQALFAEILDRSGLFPTQAITGFAGQIESAVKKASGVVEGIRHPIKGAGNLLAAGLEKLQNISPEEKVRVLKDILNGIFEGETGKPFVPKSKTFQYFKENHPSAGMSIKDVSKVDNKGVSGYRAIADLTDEAYRNTVNNGGVTIDLGLNKPTEGYAYSPYKGVETIVPKAKFTEKHIADFVDQHFAELNKEGNHLGIWEEGDNVYMDISKVGEPTQATIEEAAKNKQLAVFDLKNFKTINTPYYEEAHRLDFNQGEVKGTSQKGGQGGSQEVPKSQQEKVTPKRSIADIARENIGQIKAGKKIKDRILNEMADFTDYAAQQLKNPKLERVLDEVRARKIAERLGINPELSNWEIAKRFGKVLERYKWKPKQ